MERGSESAVRFSQSALPTIWGVYGKGGMTEAAARLFTSKQMGDAAEMIVAAELTLAGVPALKVPDNWPSYDVIAQPAGRTPQRISVKARTFKKGAAFVQYLGSDVFDWLAIVILADDGTNKRTIYIVPRPRWTGRLSETHQRRRRQTFDI